MTTLSIVIAAKNESRWLPEQLRAVEQQSVMPDEIVFVNDGSTDGTAAIMLAFAERVPGTRIVTHEQSVGASEAFSRGVAESTGTYVWPLSANDVLQPGAVARIASLAKRFPHADVLAGDTTLRECSWPDAPRFYTPDECAQVIGRQGVLHGGTTVVSRAGWDRFGGMIPEAGGWCDTLLWHGLACESGAAVTPMPLLFVRDHPGGVNAGLRTPEARVAALTKLSQATARLSEPIRTRLLASGLFDLDGLEGVRETVQDIVNGVPA